MIEPTTARIAAQLTLPAHQVAATVELIDANTLPFIARYRKRLPVGWTKNRSRASYSCWPLCRVRSTNGAARSARSAARKS